MPSSWPRRRRTRRRPERASAGLPSPSACVHPAICVVRSYKLKTAASGGTIMKFRAHLRALALGFAGAVLLTATANAAEVRVMISGGLTAAFNALVPEFEKADRQQGADRLRPVDGHHGQRHSGAARARRARGRADHGRLCARRSHQAGQGRRRTARSISSTRRSASR